jgi:hypothetical protein
MKLHRLLIVVSTVVALAACGSATDATTFTAPSGYTTAVSIGPFAQVWRGPKSRREGIVLMALPGEIDFTKIGDSTTVKDAEVLKHEDVKICGSQDAYYLSMIGEVQEYGSPAPGENPKQLIDVIATHLNGKTYMAMYVRPMGAAEDSAAEAAIKGICPRG